MLFALVLGGFTGWQLLAEREAELARARDLTMVIARTLEEHVRASFTAVDLVLSEEVAHIEQGGGLAKIPAETLRSHLLQSVRLMPQLRGLFVHAPDGALYASQIKSGQPRINGADFEYVRIHREHDGAGLFVGTAMRSPATGLPIVPLTRRIADPGGRFGGVVGAAMDPNYFEKFYQSIGLGRDASIGVLRLDGKLLARFPAVSADRQWDASSSPLWVEGVRKKDAGTLTYRTLIDGEMRVVSYRKMPDWPLVVAVSLNREVVLAPWREALELKAVITVAVLLAFGGLLLFTLRLLERGRLDEESFEQSRIAADRSLIEANERYRMLVEVSPVGIILHDRGVIEYANERAAAIMGEATPAAMLGRSSNDYVHPDDQAEVMARNAGLSEQAATLAPRVFRVIRRDDRGILVESSSSSSLQGGRVLTQVVLRDVTEEQQATAALRMSEERLATIFSVSPVAIVIAELGSGRCVQVNPAFERLSGYGGSEWLGRVSEDFQFWVDRDNALWRSTLIGEGRAGPAEFRYRSKGGREGIAVQESYVIEFKNEKRSISFIQDITERKRAEQSLGDSEAKFRKVFENASDAMWIVNVGADGRMTYEDWNRAYADTISAGDRDLAGLTPHDLFPQATADLITDHWRACVEAGEVVLRPAPLGETHSNRYLSVYLLPLKDADGRIRKIAGVSHDFTEIKRAEDEIRALNESLEKKIRVRTADMEAAYRELESFSYSVSHDLRAPARAVVGFSHIIIDEHAAELSAETRRLLERIVAAGARMSELTDGLLVMTHLSRRELQRQPMDLSAVASLVVQELREADPAREVEVLIQPGLNADADAHMVRSLLQNLIGNAWKYSSRTRAAKIEFCATEEGGAQVFVVRDNGAGFDMKYADKLFGVFQRLHTAAEFEGTGIGLATVERIVRRHGGRIRAEAKPGAGASFYFTLG